MDYETLDDLLDVIKEIDTDENLYQQMLKEPAMISQEMTLDRQYQVMCDFLKKIVDQPLEKAQRYNRKFWGKRGTNHQKDLVSYSKKSLKTLLKEKIKKYQFRCFKS